MTRFRSTRVICHRLVVGLSLLLLAAIAAPTAARAQQAAAAPPSADNAILLTIVLRHDQTKTLDEITEHLKKTGWYEKFPGAGVKIVSWYVMMGLGQVVTLRVPADQLRAVNRVIESSAWGAYRNEFYPSYDFKPVWDAMPGHHP